ncbi:hypothetical protein LXL04_013283 [Taraxacum kok-saghyz]
MAMRKHVNCWWGYSKQVMSRHGNCWWWLTLEIQVLSHMCCIEGINSNATFSFTIQTLFLVICGKMLIFWAVGITCCCCRVRGYFRYSVTGNDRTASNDVDQCLSFRNDHFVLKEHWKNSIHCLNPASSSNTTIIPTDMLRGIFVRREQPPLDASF